MNNVVRIRTLGGIAVAGCMALIFSGCASAKVAQMKQAPMSAPRPDVVIVYDFKVTSSDVYLDRGIAPQIAREMGNTTQTQEELQVGRIVSEALSKKLVAKLTEMGINACRSTDPSAYVTGRSLLLKGYFMHVDQGDQNLRVAVGFGLGGSKVETHVLAIQDNKLVADAYTTTNSGLKPGLAVNAVGGMPSLAVGVGTSTLSETFSATVEADAKRTADQLAKKIHDAYVARGWVSR